METLTATETPAETPVIINPDCFLAKLRQRDDDCDLRTEIFELKPTHDMPYRAPIAKPAGSENGARDRERARRAGGVRRLYDSAQWRHRTQPYILARDPLCTIPGCPCGGHAPSTDVDHRVRAEIYMAQHGGDERFFFDPKNLRGGCHAGHTWKTNLERRGLWQEPRG
jgi:hypothetical protein